jgi:Papain-like cysteine protease AvrRpt2
MSTSPINFNVPAPTTPQSDVNNSSADGSSNVNNTATDSGNTQLAPTAKSLADISAEFHPEQYAQTNAGNEIALNIPASGNGAASNNFYSLASASGSNANQASAAKPQDMALSLQAAKPKFVDITIQQGGFLGVNRETVPGKEIASPKWYSESTGEYAKLKFPQYDKNENLIKPGFLQPEKTFRDLGCHATGILNAANIVSGRVSGETATPRNARDYVVTSLDEKRSGVVKNVGEDNKYTGDNYRKVLNNVQFYDLRAPQKFTKITTDKLFTTPMTPGTLSAETTNRIKANIEAGNPVTIGIAAKGGQVRHTAVISGIVKDKAGVEQLMVRDNWKDENGQAKMMTLDDFASMYQGGANAKTVQVDMVWAAAPKNK